MFTDDNKLPKWLQVFPSDNKLSKWFKVFKNDDELSKWFMVLPIEFLVVPIAQPDQF